MPVGAHRDKKHRVQDISQQLLEGERAEAGQELGHCPASRQAQSHRESSFCFNKDKNKKTTLFDKRQKTSYLQ